MPQNYVRTFCGGLYFQSKLVPGRGHVITCFKGWLIVHKQHVKQGYQDENRRNSEIFSHTLPYNRWKHYYCVIKRKYTTLNIIFINHSLSLSLFLSLSLPLYIFISFILYIYIVFNFLMHLTKSSHGEILLRLLQTKNVASYWIFAFGNNA